MASIIDLSGLLAADRSHVLSAMSQFRNRTGNNWLDALHPARSGTYIQRSWPAVDALPPLERVQVVAAAAPNHCMDGWSYVARAFSALLAGDAHAARHLSYYAQLRAGMSMLANLGIGIFNGINYSINANGNTQRIDTPHSGHRALGMGTHDIVWKALKAWSENTVAARIFLDLVKVRGSSLRDCIEAIWPGASMLAAAGLLVENWGLDLRRGGEEHVDRNVSSYNPHSLNQIVTTPAESLGFISSSWKLFEPSISSSFDRLDKFLLRSVLQGQHRALHHNSRYSEGAISTHYERLPDLVKSLASKRFLLGQAEPRNPELIRRARQRSNPAQPTEMLARALLLLRASTAFTHASFVESGIDSLAGEMRPWLDSVASERGFWAPGSPLAEPTDLWTDIELALLDFDASMTPEPASWNDWMLKDAKGLPMMTEAERIGVWSLSA